MTEDTKKAIEIISPLAKELKITIDATDNVLWMNDQAIGISCNSTWATLMEMIGYIFLMEYCKEFRGVNIDWNNETIMRYWTSEEKLKKLGVEPNEKNHMRYYCIIFYREKVFHFCAILCRKCAIQRGKHGQR